MHIECVLDGFLLVETPTIQYDVWFNIGDLDRYLKFHHVLNSHPCHRCLANVSLFQTRRVHLWQFTGLNPALLSTLNYQISSLEMHFSQLKEIPDLQFKSLPIVAIEKESCSIRDLSAHIYALLQWVILNNTFKYHVFAPMGRFQLESIYLYFPPSSQLLHLCFCPVGLSLL